MKGLAPHTLQVFEAVSKLDGTIVDRMCTFDEYIEMKRGN